MKFSRHPRLTLFWLIILAVIGLFSRSKTPAPATLATPAPQTASTPPLISSSTPPLRSAPPASPARLVAAADRTSTPPAASSLASARPATNNRAVVAPATPTPATFDGQVAASQKAAVRKYPSLGTLNSAFNSRFVQEYRRLLAANSRWLKNGGWPEWLADEVDARLRDSSLPAIELNVPDGQYYVQATPTPYVDYSTPWPTVTPYTYTGSGSSRSAPGTDVYVRGYTRRDGTYVQPHTRSRPSH